MRQAMIAWAGGGRHSPADADIVGCDVAPPGKPLCSHCAFVRRKKNAQGDIRTITLRRINPQAAGKKLGR